MADVITWDDADEIAQILRARFPDTGADNVSDLELTRWVREIPTLATPEPDPPEDLFRCLQSIRAAWSRG